ncbi:GTPase Era [Nakamurella sp. YIM 132087]|uniref:GTPase Era n=1 Tax=Nakamurella alba TaxID=2665158 RepID=A0A7K1FK03_9ACTN|nr:GTPase Era [Nakamurella alba]MTD13184.1 GTPase Era [Nakamurella alba]
MNAPAGPGSDTATPDAAPEQPHRSGFACFVGRPNAGKSTLLNAMVGQKVAITSDKPQTTRRAVRGIITRDDAQMVVVDTPGMHKPRTLLGERLGDLVRSVWSDVDVIGFCVPADEKVGPGDRRIAAEIAEQAGRTPVIGVITKTDKASADQIAAQLLLLSEVREFAEIVPVSAVRQEQVGLLADLMIARLPEGPRLYPDGEVTDEPVETMISEIIRESALDGVRDELPHSLAVLVDEMGPREGRPENSPMTDIYATIYVERDSQKAIVLGRKGSRLGEVGRRSRLQIEKLLGQRVYLSLHISVAKDWQRDPKQLRKLGFDPQ